MKIKVLKPYQGEEGRTKRGQVLDVAEARAKDLMRVGLAEPAEDARKSKPAPKNKMKPVPSDKGS
jgi:hypothetical protein